MIDEIVKFKDFVPLFQTISWILFISIILFHFRDSIKILFENMIDRIKKGSSFKAGPIEIGEELASLQSADKMQNEIKVGAIGREREEDREKIYKANKGLFLTHIFIPSKIKGQKYDICIYLIKHKSNDFSDIDYVEFFFGHMWKNKVFKIKNDNKKIGIVTSAYEPFLCTCCVKFKNNTEIELYRYIDFEMENRIIHNISELI
jgi:hypothetical protein